MAGEPEGKNGESVTITVDPSANEFDALPGNTVGDKLGASIASQRVVVFGRSTCPFCIEVTRTLVDLGVAFVYYRLDQLESGAQVHEELKKATGQRTVPYVYVNGSFLGGCDATKAFIASGKFDKLVGGADGAGDKAALAAEGVPRIKLAGVDQDAPYVIGALFQFPNTVDGRVIRLVGLQVFVISLLLAVFSYQKRQSWHWVAVGLLVDFCLRFYAGAGISPLGSIAMLTAAAMDLFLPWLGIKTSPVWGAGPPKQFAVFVGIIFSALIVVLQFCHAWQAATAVASVLCCFAGLEGFLNFCAGCWFFSKAIRFGLIPDTIYMIHINTLPETKYGWEEWTKRVHPPVPQRYQERFALELRPGSKPTRIDLHYKTGKTEDWEREAFHYIVYSKMAFFSAVIGPVAIAALFRFCSLVPSMGTSQNVWKILTLLSLAWSAFFTVPYLVKCFLYPHKIRQEWQHFAMNNAFSVPWMTLVVYAFLADHYSNTLAKVLFWAGASLTMLFSVIIVGNWLSSMRHEGTLNGAFQMAPVGNFIVAVMGPIVDPAYSEVCFLWFGFALLMWIALFTITLQRMILGHNADPRSRVFSAIWIAAPSVASIAWTILQTAHYVVQSAPSGASRDDRYMLMMGHLLQTGMDSTAQTLFFMGVSMGLVLVWMAWRRFLWADKFFMQMWAFGFPTAALAWAAVLYDMTSNTALSKVLAVCLISVACIVCCVLSLRTVAGILRLKVFIPEHKWGPMSHLPLAQEALRHLLSQLINSAATLVADPGNGRVAARMSEQWRSFRTINDFYLGLKDEICFPQISAFFPGHHAKAMVQNAEMRELEGEVAAMLTGLSGGASSAAEKARAGGGTAAYSDTNVYSGTTLADKMAAALAQNKVVVVGRSTCPFCIEVTRTLADMGLTFPYFLVDTMPSGAALHEELKKATGQSTVPYVYVNGKLLGGCDATKALIASGEFDRLLGGAGGGASGKGMDYGELQAAISRLAAFALANYDYVEDHIRPVVRRYISGPVQKKIMNDCFDARPAEEWFQVLPLVVQSLPLMAQRATYVRAFIWAMPERCQQFGVMVALGVDPVTWYRLKQLVPDIIPRGEAGWKRF